MPQTLFNLKAGNEILSGLIIHSDTNNNPPRFVYLHGSGPLTTKERVYDIKDAVLQNSINVLTFDMSGHGQSTGELKKSSLEKRVLESQAIIEKFASLPLILCGASMSGYTAIKLLELFPVETLILMCPALYDRRAYNVPFDQGFTEILRTHESWRNTDALEILKKFTGKLLIIMGEKDEVIPPGVIELIMENTPRVRKKELYIIPHCPHKINMWLEDNPEEMFNMQAKISEFIR